jgi:hypothetical protein
MLLCPVLHQHVLRPTPVGTIRPAIVGLRTGELLILVVIPLVVMFVGIPRVVRAISRAWHEGKK